MDLEAELRELRREVRENTMAGAAMANKQSTLDERIENLRQLRLMEDFPLLRSRVADMSTHLQDIQALIIKRTPIVDGLVPRITRNEEELATIRRRMPDLDEAQRKIAALRVDVGTAKSWGKSALRSLLLLVGTLIVFFAKEAWAWLRVQMHF